MRCSKFEDYLKGKLDIADLRDHMENCEFCRNAYQIDTRIMDQSKKLNENIAIPHLWSTIERKIQDKKPVILKINTTAKFVFTAAATFLIITTIWMFSSKQGDEDFDRILSAQAFGKVVEAEKQYINAIKDLEKMANVKLDETTQPLAQLYRNKLSLIDRQIQNCQESLETNPANSHIRRYLMAALQDKQKTLEDILQLDS